MEALCYTDFIKLKGESKMEKLTYGKQMILGICLLTLGHILSWLTDWRFFENLGWISYGLLFLIHPVWGAGAMNSPRIKTYVRLAGAAIVLMGCFLRVGDGGDYWQRHVSESLGIDASKGTVVNSYNDHSGFHGDGTSYVVLSFEDEHFEREILAPGGWHQLPLTENLETLIYGTRTDTKATGPYIDITMSRAEKGYWYFYDRQGETTDDCDVLGRGSFNYTFALYDAEKDLLYYCEYDT